MDQPAFDAFYERSYHRVVAHVYLTCGNLAEAQDCAQEAFIRAWDKRRQLDRDGHPEAWVRTVAHRISISRWRRDRRQVPVGDDRPEPASTDPDATDRVALQRALQELPVETRRVIVLHHLHDLSVNDVAAELGVPSGTVKARLSRGRARLADLLGVQPIDTGAVPALTSLSKETTMPPDSLPGTDPYGLDRLASPAYRVPRPPAEEIRRRGGLRRRHRALAITAGGVAGALLTTGAAFSATGVWDAAPWWNPEATASPSSAGPPPVAGTPTRTPGPGQPTWDDVPTTKEIWAGERGDLEVVDESTGWSEQVAPSICAMDTEDLGARTVLQRHFGGNETTVQSVFVMGFDSTEDATRAREMLSDWYDGCAKRLESTGMDRARGTTSTPLTFDSDDKVPDGTTALFHTMMWVEPEQVEAQTGNFENATVVQVDNRIAWLVSPIRDAMDNNCVAVGSENEIQCDVAREVPDVARLLS